MELRGHRRAKKPQSGFFRRYYFTILSRRLQEGKPGENAFLCRERTLFLGRPGALRAGPILLFILLSH